MQTQTLPHPAHIDLPKFFTDYPIPSRPRVASAAFCDDISKFVDSNSHYKSTSVTVEDDHLTSPVSPSGPNYQYAHRGSADSSNSPNAAHVDVDDGSSKPSRYSASQHNFVSSSQNGYDLEAQHPAHSPPPVDSTSKRPSQPDLETAGPYLSESPSPIEVRPSSFRHPLSASHNQEQFPSTCQSSAVSYPSDQDRFAFGVSGTYGRGSQQPRSVDKYTFPPPHLDQRRMSEPAIFCNGPYSLPKRDPDAGRIPNFQFAYNPPISSPRSSISSTTPSLHRGISTGSLRELHDQHHFEYTQPTWKQEDHRPHLDSFSREPGVEEPVSPLNPNFSGVTSGSPPEMSSLHYPPIAEDPYGSSPPGTGTSTSSNAAGGFGSPSMNSHHPSSNRTTAVDSNGKTYSFVALPGNAVKKRPRRRFDEIERLYQCSWPDCTKAYGTLNHLNAHVTMQKHGPKRSPNGEDLCIIACLPIFVLLGCPNFVCLFSLI
jgi:hypothetical protein